MTPPTPTLRVMCRADLDLAIDWAAREGWNPGLSDAECFFAADPEGFLIGLVEETPAAVISAVRWGDDYGFIGLFIVRPDLRGHDDSRAILRPLLRAALARLAGRCVGLDGVVEQQDNYQRGGFQLAHRNIRYQGVCPGATAPGSTVGDELVPLTEQPFAEVTDYDRAFFPAGRDVFLGHWIAQPGATALGLIDADGRLVGYGVRRPCRVGHKIGPLFADSPEGADRLLTALRTGGDAGSPVFLDVPACTPAAIDLAQRHGMSPVFETARMYNRPPPAMALDRTYGITTFELG